MVSEIVPANVRGKYIAFMEGFWAVGYVLSGAISFFILPYLGWRWAFVVVGLLSLVVLLVRRSMPGNHHDGWRIMDAWLRLEHHNGSHGSRGHEVHWTTIILGASAC